MDARSIRGWIRSEAGDAAGALADLERVLAHLAPTEPRRALIERRTAALRARLQGPR